MTSSAYKPAAELTSELATDLDLEVELGVADGKPSRLGRIAARDAALLERIEGWRRGWITPVMKVLTFLGNTEVWLIHAVCLLAVFGWHEPNATRIVVLAISAAVYATIAGQILKRTCKRPRPSVSIVDLEVLRKDPDAFSFPSGHTAAAFAVATSLAWEGDALFAFEASLAVGIGSSRLYLGAHYPLDVLVGAMLGVLCGLAARATILSTGIF